MLDCSLQVLHTHKPADDDKGPSVIHQNISPPPAVPVVTPRPQIHQVSHPQNQNNAAAAGWGHRGQKPYDNDPIVGALADQHTKQSHHNHDNPFFEKAPTKELQQLIDRDKYDHNSNRDSFNSNHFQSNSRPAYPNMPMFGNDGLDEYLNNHDSENHFFPNSAKSSQHKSQHSFQGHNDYPSFDFYKMSKQNQQPMRAAKNKRRHKKAHAMRKRHKGHLKHFPTRKPQLHVRKTQEVADPFLDLDYIEV